MNKKGRHKIVNALSYIYIAPNRDDVCAKGKASRVWLAFSIKLSSFSP